VRRTNSCCLSMGDILPDPCVREVTHAPGLVAPGPSRPE